MEFDGFDIADLFAVDEAIAHDMATVFAYVADRPVAEYPEAYRAEVEDVIRQWRPDVWAKATEAV
jgi:N-dimethylarginine dimethylaminohydrolase